MPWQCQDHLRSIVTPNPIEIAPGADQSLIHPHLKVFDGYLVLTASVELLI
jgi:hypothetical protein